MGEEAHTRQRGAVPVEIAAAEELVAAAHCEEGRAALDGHADARALRGEIGRDQLLLAVLTAADVEEIVLARPHVVAERDRRHDQLVPPQSRSPGSTAMLPRSA